MTEKEKPVASGRLNKTPDSAVVVYHDPVQVYFRPDTEELIAIPDTESGNFDREWRSLVFHVDQLHEKNEHYSMLLEQHGMLSTTSSFSESARVNEQLQQVVEAEAEVQKAKSVLQEKIGAFDAEGLGYNEVIELIPVMKKSRQGKGSSGMGKKYVYVRKGYYTQNDKKWHTVSLKKNDKNGQGKSIYSQDKQGKTRIDTATLKERLATKLQDASIKRELSDIVDLSKLNIDETLFDWAQSWNESLQYEGENANIDVSAGAQFMRFISNVGMSGEYSPLKGEVTLKGEIGAKLSLVSGMSSATAYLPDRGGWALTYHPKNGDKPVRLALLRIYLEGQLMGFVGASVQLEGQLQMTVHGEKQLLAGQKGSTTPFRQRKKKGRDFYHEMAKEDEGLKASAEAFGGARGNLTMKGGIQWSRPHPLALSPADTPSGTSGGFVDFCTFTESIDGLAGLGAGATFFCDFIDGRFCFKVAASLCCGVGAKGEFLGVVEYGHIVEFSEWLVYQLYGTDYHVLELIATEAFIAFSKMCVMQIADLVVDVYREYKGMKGQSGMVLDKYNDFVKNLINDVQGEIQASEQRNQLAENINANPQLLLNYTPETKGILLYLLTRHGTWDHLDPHNTGKGIVRDIYQARKEAVIWVLKSIQTQREWRKVLCRCNKDAHNLAAQGDETVVVAEQRQKLINFLQEGFNRDQDLYQAEQELATIYGRIKQDVAWGVALAMNDTFHYQLNTVDQVFYPEHCVFGPCNNHSHLS